MSTDAARPTGAMVASSSSPEISIEPISSSRALLPQLERLMQTFNVITPPALVFLEGWSLVPVAVKVNTAVNDDGQGPETYCDKGFMKLHERAIGKVGLQKVAAAAGVKWTQGCGRRDDMRTPNLWSYFAEGIVDLPDGSYMVITGEREVDLRDGAAQIGGWTADAWAAIEKQNAGKKWEDQVKSIGGWSGKRVMQARTMGLQLAETKAKNRAIRSLGLQQKYTVKELEKPFVVFKAVFQPDMSDPAIKRLVTERALHGRQMLYPATAAVPVSPLAPVPLPPAGTLDAAVVSSRQDSATEPDPTVGLTVTGVQQVTHEGRLRDLWDVSFSDDRIGRTDKAEIADVAKRAQQQAWLMECTLEPSAKRQGAFIVVELSRAEASGPSASDADLY